ncbi:MAG: DUF1028 domain-containing protein [Hyphomicrobiaceae bacterium]
MTFSILGHCARSDQVGIAYTTVTLAGGGTSPFYSYGGDIVVVQAFGNQQAAIVGARALDEGGDEAQVLARIRASDPEFAYRQIGIMPRGGAGFCVTGDKARPWAGHVVDNDFVAMGNVLAGPEVVDAMAEAFRGSSDLPLAERLLSAIEAGRDAGGQQAPDDERYDERSALLRIIGDGPERREQTALDLRIDMTSDAVSEMRRMYEIYKPVIARRSLRARNPGEDMPTSHWEAANMVDNPPPPALKRR